MTHTILALLGACTAAPAQPWPSAQDAASAAPDVFAPYLDASLADGFSPPAGASCGPGCWERPAPEAVFALADGEVLPSADGVLRVRHRFLEDQTIREITAIYPDLPAQPAGPVRRGAALGQAAVLRLTLAGTDEDPAAFVAARPQLFVPAREPRLALVSRERGELRLFVDQDLAGVFPVGFGQVEGDKERVKDRKTPLGTYFIVQRSRGPFEGWYADYYGGIWLRLNYPNAYDAARGVDAGLITTAQQVGISRAWRARKPTARETALGGGIGIHAWAYPWDLDGDRLLSWGCLVVQPDDADTLYTSLPEGTMVILF